MTLKRKHLLLTMTSLALAVNSAFAQQVDDEVKEEKVENIIVTGVVNKIVKQDATFSINVLNREDIERLAPISTADLLQNVPGIFSEGSTAGEASNNITVRGLPVTGGYRYAPQLIDGLPWFEEPEVQFMNNDSAARGDLMTQAVEVVKGGTGGILYSNGLGATVNHITRKGSQEFEGAYKIEIADYNFLRHDFYTSGPISKSLTYAVGGYYRTSDGLRDTGYTADHGGQIRGNLVWNSDDDRTEIQIHGLKIDDHTAFYQNLPFQVRAFSERGTPENPTKIDQDQVWPLGINFANGTISSPSNRYFTQLGEYGSREIDFGDGLHADFDIYTVKVKHDLNDDWRLSFGLRHTDGTNDYNALFSGNDSTSASNFLNARWQNDVISPALGQAVSGNYSGAKLNGFFNIPNDPSTAFAGISREDFVTNYAKGVGVGAFYTKNGLRVEDNAILNFLLPFIANTAAKSTTLDLKLQTSFDLAGTHDLTFGVYGSKYSTDQSFQGSIVASTMEQESSLTDLYVIDSNGDKVGPSLTLNGAILPGFFGYTSEIDSDTMAYYVHDHWELLDGDLKIDMGYRKQELNATVDRLDRNITADSNFTPSGVVPGSVDDLTTADDEVQLPSNLRTLNGSFTGSGWSLGANYSVQDNLAVYGLVSNSFRLPSFEDLNEFRVSPNADTEQVEQIWQYETGVRYFAGTWDTQIAVFFNDFSPRESSIRYRDFTSPECTIQGDGIPDINTCPEVTELYKRGVENKGIEIEAAWRPDFEWTQGLELRLNTVMQDPEIVGANFRIVNTVVENDVLVGYEFRQIGENGRSPRRLADTMFNFQAVWDMKSLLGVPFKPYLKYTWFDERYSESSDFDVTLYPDYFHIDGGFIWDFSEKLSLQLHVANLTNELSFTEGDPLVVPLKGPNGATNRGVARPLFGRTARAMLTYRF